MPASTEDSLNDLKEIFSLHDKQGDGKIDSSQLGNVLRAMGFNPTDKELRDWMKAHPQPTWSIEEFQSTILSKPSLAEKTTSTGSAPAMADEFIQAFQIFDKDGNGLISSGELRYVLTSLGEKLTEKEVDDLLKCVDVDKHGYVNYATFVKTVLSG